MSWNATQRTTEARVQAVLTLLQPLLVAAGLPPLADDPIGEGGKAVYAAPVLSYQSPCVEILPCEGPITTSGKIMLTEMDGWIILSYRSTDSALPLKALATGYLTALVGAFAVAREGPDEYWEVVEVSTSPAEKTGTVFAQAVAVRVLHQISEER